MLRVMINGKEFPLSNTQISSMPDLIEYIKANIDPDLMITTLLLAGKELSEVDWQVPLSVHGDSVLEVTTGSKQSYLTERFTSSIAYVDHIVEEFSFARTCYQDGRNEDANNAMTTAVRDLNAFLNWYNTLLTLTPESMQQQLTVFYDQVEDIAQTCERLVQQQLYNSWWALGETMKNDLEPKLCNLKNSCSDFAQHWQ